MSSSDSTKIKDKLHDTTGNEISFYLYLTIPNLLDSVSIDILNEDGTNEFDTVFIIDPDDPYADTLIFSNIFYLPGVKKLEGNLFLNNGSIKPLPAKTITIAGKPAKITEQPPDSLVVTSGEKVEFSIDVTGDEPIIFQWFRNNLKLDDDTSKTLLIDSATSENAGKYYCVINNPYGPSVVSDTITVVVDKKISEAPVVNDDSYSVKEDSILVIDKSKGILVNDINPDGNSLKVSLIDSTQNGLLELNSDGSFIYTASQDFFGSDSFTYKAVDSDNIESAEKATVRIRVEPVNDKPVSKPDTFSVVQDAILKIVVKNKGVLNNDHDIDGDSLTAVLDSTVKYGKLEF
ncbi:MAG: cadherin-like domain-containing protein, partial [Fibrobacter sp.]|nr:cadherin-like domain-containing protein [Fibrobacter sp.]